MAGPRKVVTDLDVRGELTVGGLPVGGGGGASELDDLSDVDLTTTAPTTDDVLTFDGADWVPSAGGGGIAEVHVGDEEPTGDEVLWFKTDASPWAPFFMLMGG